MRPENASFAREEEEKGGASADAPHAPNMQLHIMGRNNLPHFLNLAPSSSLPQAKCVVGRGCNGGEGGDQDSLAPRKRVVQEQREHRTKGRLVECTGQGTTLLRNQILPYNPDIL